MSFHYWQACVFGCVPSYFERDRRIDPLIETFLRPPWWWWWWAFVSPKNENTDDTGLPNCWLKYFWTSGWSESGFPSSIEPKKLKLVIQVVLKNCSYCPITTRVPFMYPPLSFFRADCIANDNSPLSSILGPMTKLMVGLPLVVQHLLK